MGAFVHELQLAPEGAKWQASSALRFRNHEVWHAYGISQS